MRLGVLVDEKGERRKETHLKDFNELELDAVHEPVNTINHDVSTSIYTKESSDVLPE